MPEKNDKSNLRVAIVSTANGWRGGEEQARLLALGLRDRGHALYVLARRDAPFANRMREAQFEVATFKGRGWNPVALAAGRRALASFTPDVLFFNDAHAVTTGGMVSLALDVPARIASRRVDFPIRLAARYRKFCDRLICVSNGVAEVCRASGVPSQMLSVVRDGVDPSRARSGNRARGRAALSLAENEILLLTIASLTDHKGHRFLIGALPKILRRRPNVRLALAGDGELREALERQADELGVRPQIDFLGFRDDVPDLIAACDLYVLPSHLEGLGSSLIDVMLTGRPIVATTAGGIPELVGESADDGTVAWTAPPRNSAALAAAVDEAIQSPQQCTFRTRRARGRAERLFTADCMVENTLAVFRTVVASAQSRIQAA